MWSESDIIQLFLQPILAVGEAGDDEGDDIVSGGIDHGCGGVNEVAQRDGDGVGNCKLVGEEDGAEYQFAGAAASGDAGHGNGGENGHDDGENCSAGAEVKTEDAEEESDLYDGAHG